MKVEFDSKGYPNVVITNKAVLAFQKPEEIVSSSASTSYDEGTIGSKKFVPWYDDNAFPEKAIELISDSPVLKRAIIINAKITAGQGIVPARISEYSLDGKDKLEIVNEHEINKLLNRYMIRKYIAKAGYDLFALGNGFVKLIPNANSNKILRIVPINARHCRLEVPKNGKVENVHVLGDWEEADSNKLKTYPLLDEDYPLGHLQEIAGTGKLKAPVVMQLKSDFTANDFYPMPEWYTAKQWIEIASKVAKALDAGMDNMLNIFIHVKIPYSYWDKKYPLDEFDGKLKERKEKIQSDLEQIEEKLTSAENAKKTLMTMFGDSDANEDKWELEVIERKFNQEDFVKSTAADTQAAIGAGVMPDLLGLMHGNSKGGSMQRELLLIQYALSWLDRQKLADPLELMLQFNMGESYSDVQIMFRNTFLTILESGSGTDSNIS